VSRGKYRKPSYKQRKEILRGDKENLENLYSSRRKKKFLKHYHVDKENFWKLNEQIKGHWVFGTPGTQQQLSRWLLQGLPEADTLGIP
jgi:hypothetical protein